MVLDRSEFYGILVGLEAGRRIGKQKLNEFYIEAGKRGINLIRPGTFIMDAPPVQQSLIRRGVGRLAQRSPYIVGGAVAYDALQGAPERIADIMDDWDMAQGDLGIPEGKRTNP